MGAEQAGQTDQASLQRRDRVHLALEAKARGAKNALAFRRWCRRHGVPVLRDGNILWVRPADVDRALDQLAGPAPVRSSPVADAVGLLTGGKF